MVLAERALRPSCHLLPIGSELPTTLDHGHSSIHSNGTVCTRPITERRSTTSVKTWALPHSLRTTPFSSSFYKFRPWIRGLERRNGGMLLSPR